MSSTSWYEDCPECKGKQTVYVDLQCNTQEENRDCTCGYFYNHNIDWDRWKSSNEYDPTVIPPDKYWIIDKSKRIGHVREN